MSVKYIAVKFCPFHFRNGRVTAASLLKPPFGGFRIPTATWIQKWFKTPLELLVGSIIDITAFQGGDDGRGYRNTGINMCKIAGGVKP
jgi:hypothetical protein